MYLDVFDGDYTWGKTIPDFHAATVVFPLWGYLNIDLNNLIMMSNLLLQNRLLLLRERATYLQRMDPPCGVNRKRLLSTPAD